MDGIAPFVHSAIPRSKDPVLLLPRSAQSASYILGLTTTSSHSSSVALHICTINQLKHRRWSYNYENIAVSMANRALGFASCLISLSTTIFHDCHGTLTGILWEAQKYTVQYYFSVCALECRDTSTSQVTIQSQCVSLPFL